MTVEAMPQLSTKDLKKDKEIIPSSIPKEKGKEVEVSHEEIDLQEDMVIPDWDLSNLTPDQMDTLGELWKKRARQQKLREKKKKRNQVSKLYLLMHLY